MKNYEKALYAISMTLKQDIYRIATDDFSNAKCGERSCQPLGIDINRRSRNRRTLIESRLRNIIDRELRK